MSTAEPLVSVCMITYNQDRFIREAIDGVLLQQTTFNIEIVIGDDASTDATSGIIREYAEKYPHKIRARFNNPNLGMVPNMLKTLSECRGKYIAFCEGDDFWTDPMKIQKQVDFMDEHPAFSMCFHDVEVLYSDKIDRPYPFAPANEISETGDIIRAHFIPTPSLLFRNGLITSFPAWVNKVLSFDICFELMLSLHGNIGKLPGKMAVYRQHAGGVSKSEKHIKKGVKRLIFLLRHFDSYSGSRFSEIIGARVMPLCTLQLKMEKNKGLMKLPERIWFFRHYLHYRKPAGFRGLRAECYTHLFPETYRKIKRSKA